jgi:murein DD-endopeptidase MepM/ murein hydrolase activator NlpD
MKSVWFFIAASVLMTIQTDAIALEVKGMQVDVNFKMQAPSGCAEIKSWHGDQIDMDGTRRDQMHRGLDIVAPLGTPVIAAAPGKVIYKDKQGPGGNSLMVWHGQDVHGNHTISYHSHFDEFKVGNDAIVKRGDVIGTLGATGSNMPRSGTPHLHFEVLIYPDAEFKYWFTGFLRGFTTVSPNYFSYPIAQVTGSKINVPVHYPVFVKTLDYGDGDWINKNIFTGFTFPLGCSEAKK